MKFATDRNMSMKQGIVAACQRSGRLGAGPYVALEFSCPTTKEAAPLVAVFDEWAPRIRPICAAILARAVSGECVRRACRARASVTATGGDEVKISRPKVTIMQVGRHVERLSQSLPG